MIISITFPWHWAKQSLPYANNGECLARKRHILSHWLKLPRAWIHGFKSQDLPKLSRSDHLKITICFSCSVTLPHSLCIFCLFARTYPRIVLIGVGAQRPLTSLEAMLDGLAQTPSPPDLPDHCISATLQSGKQTKNGYYILILAKRPRSDLALWQSQHRTCPSGHLIPLNITAYSWLKDQHYGVKRYTYHNIKWTLNTDFTGCKANELTNQPPPDMMN